MLSPNFIPARYRVLTTSRFDFPNTDVFKIPIQKHGNLFSCGHRFLHFWGSWVSGLQFAESYEARNIVLTAGQQVSFVSLSDLIRSKVAAGRPQDLADVDHLRNERGEN